MCDTHINMFSHTLSPLDGRPISDCSECHRNDAWAPATFNHDEVASGTCTTCHNGTIAAGKNASHLPTTTSCEQCHRTTAWTPATFTHNGVAAGGCTTCHNGTIAAGKNASHLPTTASCDQCHRTTAWTPATFDHSSVTRSEEHTSEIQSLMRISYAVFCLKKQNE